MQLAFSLKIISRVFHRNEAKKFVEVSLPQVSSLVGRFEVTVE